MSQSAFFYGTLLHPRILKRVIQNDGDHLELCPAVLLDYTRHKVALADYPGIVPYEKDRAFFKRDLCREDRCVRGTYVKGLSAKDIRFLDIFEGSDYRRLEAMVHPLSPLTPLNGPSETVVTFNPEPLPPIEDLAPPLPCQTYVWTSYLDELEPELWSYEVFVRDNLHKWVGGGADNNEYYEEVDREAGVDDGQVARVATKAGVITVQV